MNTDFFIKRPVFASVLSIILLLVGLICYFKLPTSLFPRISASVINIRTTYPGASAEVMEGFVSSPIESAVAGVNGLEYLSSKSRNGSSRVTLVFKLGYDLNQAIADTRDKVAQAQRRLPRAVSTPIIEKSDPNNTPAIFIAFSSDSMGLTDMTNYITQVIQSQLEMIDGVAFAQLMGGRDYAMRLWLDPNKMTHQGVTINDIIDTVNSNNLLSPAGHIDSNAQSFSLTAQTGLHSAEQFNKVILTSREGHLTRLEDVGKSVLGAVTKNSSASIDGKKSVLIGIIPRSDANQVLVSKEVKKVIKEIQPQLPQNVNAEIVWDNSKFIEASIHEVKKTILEATLFVIIVMFLFLGSFRLLTIPMITIPLSLVSVCSLMLLLGFSLNTLTFLAFVLAIGLVVDDAIVVTENIQRHIENGLKPFQAAIKGAKEIQTAVIAMTLTLAAAYAPIGFMSGLTGALFKEFAFTLAGAVLVSGFIALTLSPMMCAKLIKPSTKNSPRLSNLSQQYANLLPFVLKKRLFAPFFILAVLSAAYFLYQNTPQELAPKEDVGSVLTMFKGPQSSNLNHTEKFSHQVEAILNQVPEKETIGIINGFGGANAGIAFMALKPWSERKRSSDNIVASIFPSLSTITGVTAFALNPHILPGSQGLQPIEFILQTTGSYENLFNTTTNFLELLKNNPMFVNASSNMEINKPEYKVNINRERAGYLGIPMIKLARAINLALGENSIGLFSMNGHSYDVIPNLMPEYTNSPEAINHLQVRNAQNELTPLANLVSIEQTIEPSSLNHFMQMRSAKITASLAPGHTLGDAISTLKNVSAEKLPDNISYSFSGASRQYLHASDAMWLTFVAALVFIFLLLAAQYESFVTPFVIMFTVPLSILGALITLKIIGGTMNIYTQIGLVTLVGLITKHGILIVEFAEQLREEGKDITEAIITASKTRLRPILMTTAAIILGAIPLALSSGAGAIARQQIGWVIIGGMSFGTFMTLFIVPAMYVVLTTASQTFIISSNNMNK